MMILDKVDLQIFCNGSSLSHSLPQARNLLFQLLMMIIMLLTINNSIMMQFTLKNALTFKKTGNVDI